MKRIRRQRGFTLVEIMIVVAIIALLAAIAIPNVLRGRATANETAAIGNVRALISSLEMYRSVYQQYVDTEGNWLTRMYTGITPPYGPPSFGTSVPPITVQSFTYDYYPAGTPVSSYVLRAIPQTSSAGTRVIFGTEAGQVFHCVGTVTGQTTPPLAASIVTVDRTPAACP